MLILSATVQPQELVLWQKPKGFSQVTRIASTGRSRTCSRVGRGRDRSLLPRRRRGVTPVVEALGTTVRLGRTSDRLPQRVVSGHHGSPIGAPPRVIPNVLSTPILRPGLELGKRPAPFALLRSRRSRQHESKNETAPLENTPRVAQRREACGKASRGGRVSPH